MKPSARDLAALLVVDQAGLTNVPTADSVSELAPEQAVETALAWHLARVEARVEGNAQPLKPVRVDDQWAEGTDPTRYPALCVRGRTSTPRDAITGVPVQVDGQDVISDDGRWALWSVGEDVGEGFVHVFATYKAHRNALRRSVEEALSGDLNALTSLALPLPEAALPPPFVGLFDPAQFPRVRISLGGQSDNVDDESAAAGGIWRADVPFRWQAPRLSARPRIPDLKSALGVQIDSET